MATTTWTCASGHTHDFTKLLRGLEPDATPGAECKGSGDRIVAQDYGSSAATKDAKAKWTASTRTKGAVT